MTDLLPCPFCGGEPELREAENCARDVWLVRCTSPECQCKTMNHYGKVQPVFIWNQRIVPWVKKRASMSSTCPTCFRTDQEYKRGREWGHGGMCGNPWHGDDHLRATSSLTSKDAP